MRDAARLLLDSTIDRRTFVSRLAGIGVGAAAAGGIAQGLASPVEGPAPPTGRVLTGLTGGELTAELLRDWDVRYVFGLGGSEEVGFLDALVDRLDLQYVQALHEGSVMAMADGYARASGQTSFVNLHSVAGLGYALAPLVDAFKDRIPIVITAGRQSTPLRGQNAFLEAVNLHQIPRDYTQWTWDVMSAETIPEVLRRAFLLARVPPGGPTFVTFSKDLWETRVARAEIVPQSRSEPNLDVPADEHQVARTVDLLVGAELPVIVAGREFDRHGGMAHLVEIAELLGAPVFMDLPTAHSPVLFPTTHPHYAGMFAEGTDFPGAFDLFWNVGGTMFSLGAPVASPLIPSGATIVHTSIDPAEVGRNHAVDVGMIASPRLATAAILEELRRRTLDSTAVAARRDRVTTHHAARAARLQTQAENVWNSRPIASERLAVELNRRMAPDAIVVSELVTSEPFLSAYLDLDLDRRPRRNLTSSGGVLGWGVAAAVGAKIAQPSRQVVGLVGDGSFQFGLQALWTAVRYEVPIAVVIWNNGAYQANRRHLHNYGGRAAETGKYIGCSLGSPEIDHVAIAGGYGVEAERIEDPAGLGDALDRCFGAVSTGRPYVVDVKIAPRLGGADSTWFDFFSVARGEPRRS